MENKRPEPQQIPELVVTPDDLLAEVGLLSLQRQKLVTTVQRLRAENAELRARLSEVTP
jgi:regulator of replication initiation timing